ncbi:hypothetical protein Vadar_004356 [Vaccinium darrowii]|uniref:Uncharacterized protein n=1 Tax=Vaccinium darrowii TaxID=229202 RepID=A0ACB7XWL1_9ERIC|nr:hypothetical protein Vadar_004356 [Vaccinium darrowii]
MPRSNKPPVKDEDARTVMKLRAYIVTLEREMKERDKSHAMEIATIEREMKERDESHAMEIQHKDEEIVAMNEKSLSLLVENGKIWDELTENIVHEVTHSAIPISKDKQRLLVTHLKGKHRRGTEKEEFVYPKKRKRLDPVTFDEGVSSKEVINADTYVEKTASKPVEIKGLKKNLVYWLMSSWDKDKIDRIWKEVTCSTSIWCGTILRCSVFVEDLRCLIIEAALNGNTLIAGKTHEELNGIFGHMMCNTSTYRYLFFPIYNHFHWTLLVLDNKEGTWKFYNSLCPRASVDHNLESAKIVKIAVDNYFKGNSGGLFCIQDCQPIQQEEAPLQVAGR